MDDVVWASVWLYKALGEVKYLEMAEDMYRMEGLDRRPDEFFYNNKIAGIQVM